MYLSRSPTSADEISGNNVNLLGRLLLKLPNRGVAISASTYGSRRVDHAGRLVVAGVPGLRRALATSWTGFHFCQGRRTLTLDFRSCTCGQF